MTSEIVRPGTIEKFNKKGDLKEYKHSEKKIKTRWNGLQNRHVQIIANAGTIGTGPWELWTFD